MNERVDEIRNRCEHAVDAMRLPWAMRPHDPGECIISKGSGNETVCSFVDEDEPQAAFILNAPADVRYLLSKLTAASALLRRCEDMLKQAEWERSVASGAICADCLADQDEDEPHTADCPYAALLADLKAETTE